MKLLKYEKLFQPQIPNTQNFISFPHKMVNNQYAQLLKAKRNQLPPIPKITEIPTKTNLAGRGTEDPLLLRILQLADQPGVLGLVHSDLVLHNHEEPVPTHIKFHQAGLLPDPTTKAPLTTHQVEHRQAPVPAHSQSQLPRWVHREIVDSLPVGAKRLEEDKRIGVKDGHGAVGGGGDEIAREGEMGRGEEGEGGDGGGVVMKRAKVGS